ncbi:KilA-N domain-containing protein [Nitrosomonas sp.]|uniref:KilA-N domain-containing protein n=1 Tax=Nitrosomonas sp. TaxID=42353 RepID=UPI0025F85D48|nr:KilA-N domain-containing protein [Nitrosomonas sp.]
MAGCGSLNDRGDEPQTVCDAAFLLSDVALYGRAGQGAARLAGAIPVFQPVQFRPPRLEAWEAVPKTNWRSHTMTELTILTTKIRQLDGLYSLNDLHKAAGGKDSYKTANFMRLDSTQALIAEIQSSEMSLAERTIHGGPNRGTYVCRELVIAYAAWISAAFHLQVIRVFLSQPNPKQKSLPLQPAEPPKRYNYPRKLLEQSGFVSADGKCPARLNMSMLANTKAFISPLMHLLNEMRADGHDVSAPWDEFIAMREALIAADKALEKIYIEALQVNFRSASTAGNK